MVPEAIAVAEHARGGPRPTINKLLYFTEMFLLVSSSFTPALSESIDNIVPNSPLSSAARRPCKRTRMPTRGTCGSEKGESAPV